MIFQVEPRNIAGRDSLVYWENFLSTDQINYILSLPEWINTTSARIGTVNDDDVKSVLDEKIRRTNVGWMGVNEQTVPIWKSLTNVVSEINRRYFHFDLTGCYEQAQLGLYTAKDQSHYGWHTDADLADGGVPRKLSMVLSLSDPHEFEGGELQIKLHGEEIKTLEIAKGRAWFFPSWVLHRVTPVTKGVRRSLVLWVGGPPFK